jgi:hypothetical protein
MARKPDWGVRKGGPHKIDPKAVPAELIQPVRLRAPLRFRAKAGWDRPHYVQHVAKIDAVFRLYEIDPSHPSAWENLAWRLLEDFVPGFQVLRPTGAPRRWSSSDQRKLIADIEDLAKDGSIKEACRLLARSRPYRRFGSKAKSPEPRTLHERYKKAKRKYKGASDSAQ